MKRIRDASLIPPLLIKVELTALAFLVMIKRKKLKRRGKKKYKRKLVPFSKNFSISTFEKSICVGVVYDAHTHHYL